MEQIPADAFLESYPTRMRRIANDLRRIIRRTVPEAVETVRPGWRLIGYNIPDGRRSVYFAFVIPEPIHVHLGFEHGIFMNDPEGRLQGVHLKLRKVRFVTIETRDEIEEDAFVALVREAKRIALMPRGARLASLLDREDEEPRGL